jgi:hypothetical protein
VYIHDVVFMFRTSIGRAVFSFSKILGLYQLISLLLGATLLRPIRRYIYRIA